MLSEKALEACRRYHKKHPLRLKLKRIRLRAKKNGLPFNLEEGDIEIPDMCPVLGIPIKQGYPNTASLDRIDPSKGYTKDNVRVISHRANSLKSNATVEELELVLKDARNLYAKQCNRADQPSGLADTKDA